MSQDFVLLDLRNDLKDKAFNANEKINHNLIQLNPHVKLLPVSEDDSAIQDMSELKYFSYIHEILVHNSEIIGFDYPKLDLGLSFAFSTKEKVYKPISTYLEKISQN